MPRSGGGSRSRMGAPPRPYSSSGFVPRSTSPPKPATNSQNPGLMKQMAATAGGVAAGNLIAGALMGPRNVVIVNEQNQEKQEDPCVKEIKQLLECIQMIQQTGENISVCEGFRLKLAKCREQFGDPFAGKSS